jgi:NADH-quinone oxidoreductase subunit L
MSDLGPYLWLIPALPLAASVLTAFLGPRLLRRQSHWPTILAIGLACVVSIRVAAAVGTAPEHEAGATSEARPFAVEEYYRWIDVGSDTDGVHIGFTLRADALSAMMVVMITFISFFIAVYSVGYMHGDPGYARFFAEIALFVFMMTLLVLADNFILLYAGWEGVGLCSYLLIGFWFTKPAAANAARKAFLVTRIGDVGLLLGIFLLWWLFGHNLDFEHVLTRSGPGGVSNWLLLGACLLLFCGACGKSAQFPLHVWLPDAMEGPTPVSALIHAATMVTAGVYLVARCAPLFAWAPAAQLVVAAIGGFTAFLAALIALTQTDLKRVLAYSTISQLGYMFLALGCAVRRDPPEGDVTGKAEFALITFGVVAAMFHLFTHAFFKALLFLSAGSVMHGMGHVIDMRRFSGLRKVMPITHWTFLCGALALAGIPPLSGFWSKDEVLAAAWMAGRGGSPSRGYLFLWALGLLTAGMTAFYTFRAYFLTFHGELRVPPEADAPHHDHADEHGHAPEENVPMPALEAPAQHPPRASYESPWVMTIPLIVLAVFAVLVGGILGPSGLFAEYLERTPPLPAAEEHGLQWGLMGISFVVAAAGALLAVLCYWSRPTLPKMLAARFRDLYQLSHEKFHIDELYDLFIVQPLAGFAAFCRVIDQYLVDGIVDLVGHIPRLIGARFRPVQNGLVQFYALAMVLGLTVFLLALVSRL